MSIEGLALMHLHNDLDIDKDIICQLFISRHLRRMFQSCLLFESAYSVCIGVNLHVTGFSIIV